MEEEYMITFNPDITEIVFFDLEFYVPKGDRDFKGASLLFNPGKEGHILLGGVFTRWKPLVQNDDELSYDHIWFWKEKNEKNVLEKIYTYFQESWKALENKKSKQADLILCGTGISRTDVPVLLTKSLDYAIDSEEKIFDCYLKTKHVDLTNVAIPIIDKESEVLYPKPTGEILKYFNIESNKVSSKIVWKWYDKKKYKAISERTEKEVIDCVKIYKRIMEKLAHI